MAILHLPEWFLLGYIGLFLPWAAVRSRSRLRGLESADVEVRHEAEAELPSRARILSSTLVTLLALALFCWLLAPTWQYDLFGGAPVDATAIVWGVAALSAQVGLLALSRALRTPDERRRLLVRRLVPQRPRDWALMLVVIAAAAFAEEAAYRGLGMLFLGILTGNAWLSAFLLATAFAVAHAVQGRQSMVIVLAMALVMHALVALTGTLVVAMAVHAAYDLGAVVVTAWAMRTEGAAALGATAA
ncbi:MAG: CPBP family intramembrane metalloprotease [Gemmatimonadota bacterium]|nr:CPBP family intramembrane metalloprotease [Gemmatimonadota bacterium]